MHFSDYLDAKFALDERSLNPSVRSEFLAALQGRTPLSCLDLGTGSGASLRRLVDADVSSELEVIAIDRHDGLLDLARQRMARHLRGQGFTVAEERGAVLARRPGCDLTFAFLRAELPGFVLPDDTGRFDAVLAHQVMDLLPPDVMAGHIARWLRPDGVFYATLNYDGATALFPPFRGEGLEDDILAAYDSSMEQRRVSGLATGGARSGRRLHAAMAKQGVEPIAYGSSDWNIVPVDRAYRDRDRECLAALLDFIVSEAAQSGRFPRTDLDRWYRDRRNHLAGGRLGLIVHQIDLLARRVRLPETSGLNRA